MVSPLNKVANALYKKSNGSGIAPTVILLHGNSSSVAVWQDQLTCEKLSSFPMVALDLPGHGGSFRNGAYSVPALIEILKKNIASYESVVLVGHSLGGHLAIELLPELKNCSGLLICGTPPIKKPINLGEAFMPDERMGLLFKKDLGTQEARQFAECVCGDFQIRGFDILKAVLDTDPKFREGIWVSVSKGELADEFEILEKAKIPIALIYGAEDPFVNANYLNTLQIPLLWKDKIHMVENSGHSPHLERPEQFNSLLFDFLNDLA